MNDREIGISILAVLADRDRAPGLRGGEAGGISILAVLADRDRRWPRCRAPRRHFNPRGPCGPRLATPSRFGLRTGFQSSRSLRTATYKSRFLGSIRGISILAVLADRDLITGEILPLPRHFNPRGPCGPRLLAHRQDRGAKIFQSSQSLRTATCDCAYKEHIHFSISILAVLADRDLADPCKYSRRGIFQSSRSLRTATALRQLFPSKHRDFNPRGPCGPRLDALAAQVAALKFQSSRSLRTATTGRSKKTITQWIFQSSRSLRTATALVVCTILPSVISILAVLADRDCFGCICP